MKMRTPLGSVRGLGSAKEGTGHFWAQRVTAVALIPIALYFVGSLIAHKDATYTEFTGWVSTPLGGTSLLLLVLIGFYHMSLGLQVVIEDYIHKEPGKIFLLVLNKFWAVGGGLLAVYSLLKIAFAS